MFQCPCRSVANDTSSPVNRRRSCASARSNGKHTTIQPMVTGAFTGTAISWYACPCSRSVVLATLPARAWAMSPVNSKARGGAPGRSVSAITRPFRSTYRTALALMRAPLFSRAESKVPPSPVAIASRNAKSDASTLADWDSCSEFCCSTRANTRWPTLNSSSILPRAAL